jgi:hypothetical protein
MKDTNVWLNTMKERHQLDELGVDRRIILKGI